MGLPRVLPCRECGGTNADNPGRAITLTKNSQFYVRQGDVERLISQGYLQKLG